MDLFNQTETPAKKKQAGVPRFKNKYSDSKRGTLTIGGKKKHFRSAWEANMAAYYEYRKKKGEIVDWFFECETFWFENIRRGVRSYLPDFKIINKDGSVHFEEIKGFMDKKSLTKLKRMRKYYPHIKIVVISSEQYKEIEKLSNFIPDWGKLR